MNPRLIRSANLPAVRARWLDTPRARPRARITPAARAGAAAAAIAVTLSVAMLGAWSTIIATRSSGWNTLPGHDRPAGRIAAQEEPTVERLFMPLLAPDAMTGRAPVAQTLPSPPERSELFDLALDPERKLLFAADSENGLRIFDITRPTDPRELSRIRPFSSHGDGPFDRGALGVAIEWPYAYVMLAHALTAVLDISDPRAPVQVADAGPPLQAFQTLPVAAWDRLLVRSYFDGIHVYDIARRSDPHRLHRLDTPDPASRDCSQASGLDQLYEHQDTAYYVRTCGIAVVSFDADAQAIDTRHVGVDLHAWDSALAADLDRLYVVGAFGGLEVFDISRPAHPTRVAVVSQDDFPFWQMDINEAGAGVAWIGQDRFTPVDLRNAPAIVTGQTVEVGQDKSIRGTVRIHGDVAYVIVGRDFGVPQELRVYDGIEEGEARLVRRIR